MTTSEPPDLAHWGLHCFCLDARKTPHTVVRADTNGRILYEARKGTTRRALESKGIACTDSQLLVLQAYGLLQVDAQVLRTAFPVLGGDAMSEVRRHTNAAAVSLAPLLARDVGMLGARLASLGFASHFYAVVFGHVLDGLVWEDLRARALLPSTALSIDRPFWNGAFWAIYPARSGVAGTNESQRQARTLVSVWTEDTVEALHAVEAEWQRGKELTVPVIRPENTDPIHAIGLPMAAKSRRHFRSWPRHCAPGRSMVRRNRSRWPFSATS